MVGLVGLLGCERGEDDVAASSGEADDRGVVAFSFGSFAVVEGLGVGRTQGCEGGEEHGVLEAVVASSALGFAVDRFAGIGGLQIGRASCRERG